MSQTEKDLKAENENLSQENSFLKALLQDVGEHLIDLTGQEDDEWMCRCCGARAPLSADTRDQKKYPHDPSCALYTA